MKLSIIVEMMGGLGNQMFQYARGLSIATQFEMDIKLDLTQLKARHPDSVIRVRFFRLQKFGLQDKIISTDFLKTMGMSFDSTENRRNLMMIATGECPTSHTILRGWYQGEKFFSNVQKEVRQIFSFRRLVSWPASEIERMIEGRVNTVAVHIRRGDYVNNKFHEICDRDYYLRAKFILEMITENPLFIVFSEDIQYCRQFMGEKAVYVDESISDVESMHLMSSCKHHVISNSTFSWWAAWLADSSGRQVMAPARWFNDEDMNHHYLVENKLYPADWKVIRV